jgi:hypothetical protein
VNNRAHAQLNPLAVWNGTPLTLDDYFDSPVVAAPLRRVDCDMPIDTSVVIILARADRVSGLRHKAAVIEAVSCVPGPTVDHDTMNMMKLSSYYIGQDLWKKTDLRQSDVDVAEVYDGISFQALYWLEDLRRSTGSRISASSSAARPAPGSPRGIVASAARSLSAPTVASSAWVATTASASSLRPPASCGAAPAPCRSRGPRLPWRQPAAAPAPPPSSSPSSAEDRGGTSVGSHRPPRARIASRQLVHVKLAEAPGSPAGSTWR